MALLADVRWRALGGGGQRSHADGTRRRMRVPGARKGGARGAQGSQADGVDRGEPDRFLRSGDPGHQGSRAHGAPFSRHAWRRLEVVALRLQSGGTTARFSYPDFEAYRDGLRSVSGVIAFSIEQLTLSDAGGIAGNSRLDAGTLLLGLFRTCGRQQRDCECLRRFGELLRRAGRGSRYVAAPSTP